MIYTNKNSNLFSLFLYFNIWGISIPISYNSYDIIIIVLIT